MTIQDYEHNYITGWVKLYRSFINWEWFTIPYMVHIFIYCLLKANHQDNRWRGIKIKRGSFITSLDTIKKDTGLSIQQIRTCLTRLEKSREINKQSNKQYTIITICNYDVYQGFNEDSNKQLTNDQQTSNKQLTTNNNDNNNNKDNIDIDFDKLLESYNTLTGKNTRKVTDKAKRQIKARYKEGYTKSDIWNAMLNCSKDKFHKENNYKYFTLEFITREDKLNNFLSITNKEYKHDPDAPENRKGEKL